MSAVIFNRSNTSTITLPAPYGFMIGPGLGVVVTDSPSTVIANLGGASALQGIPIEVDLAQPGSAVSTPPASMPSLSTAATWSALQSFGQLLLGVWNAAKNFQAKFTFAGTANRTITIPDATCTLAQSGATPTGSTAATRSPRMPRARGRLAMSASVSKARQRP